MKLFMQQTLLPSPPTQQSSLERGVNVILLESECCRRQNFSNHDFIENIDIFYAMNVSNVSKKPSLFSKMNGLAVTSGGLLAKRK